MTESILTSIELLAFYRYSLWIFRPQTVDMVPSLPPSMHHTLDLWLKETQPLVKLSRFSANLGFWMRHMPLAWRLPWNTQISFLCLWSDLVKYCPCSSLKSMTLSQTSTRSCLTPATNSLQAWTGTLSTSLIYKMIIMIMPTAQNL